MAKDGSFAPTDGALSGDCLVAGCAFFQAAFPVATTLDTATVGEADRVAFFQTIVPVTTNRKRLAAP